MTHDERRLLCLLARLTAGNLEHQPDTAREIRKKVRLVQRQAMVIDAERRARQRQEVA